MSMVVWSFGGELAAITAVGHGDPLDGDYESGLVVGSIAGLTALVVWMGFISAPGFWSKSRASADPERREPVSDVGPPDPDVTTQT
jgi:hypothetical protein